MDTTDPTDPKPDPEPRTEDTAPVKRPEGDPPSRVRTALKAMGLILLLVTGITIGVFLCFGRFPVYQLVRALGFVAAVAIVVVVLLLVLKRWFVPAGERAATRVLHRLSDAAHRPDQSPSTLIRNVLDESRGDAATLLRAFFIGRAYWLTLAALAGIVGGAITASQLVVLTQQTERLTEQNQLIQLEGRLAAIARQADLQQQNAARSYDEITMILDNNASAGAVVYALGRLPEAMLMPVELVDPDWSPSPATRTPGIRTVYPNLRSLAERLLLYAKSDRPSPGGTWSDEEIGSVSTAIAHALHRLGFGNADETPEGGCVWHAIFDTSGTLHDDVDKRLNDLLRDKRRTESLSVLHAPAHTLLLIRVRQTQVVHPDLRHIRVNQLDHVQLPNATLVGGQFQHVVLRWARLHNADLTSANLQGTNLRYARLDGSDLFAANLQGAGLGQAHLQGADLQLAQLQGADLRHAQLQAANLAEAGLQGAALVHAQLQAAKLARTELQCANVSYANFQGAFLWKARLQGASLQRAHLQGATLDEAELQGASLADAYLAAGSARFLVDPNTGIPTDRIEIPTPPSGAFTVQLEFPAATLFEAAFGSGFRLDPRSDQVQRALIQGDIDTLWWPTREAAGAYLRERLGDGADAVIAELEERITNFEGASRDGVLIDEKTISAIPEGEMTPPAGEAFQGATDTPLPGTQEFEAPYRFPSWEELLELAKQQAAERDRQQAGEGDEDK